MYFTRGTTASAVITFLAVMHSATLAEAKVQRQAIAKAAKAAVSARNVRAPKFTGW